MLPNQKQYIINLANLNAVKGEDVGELALSIRDQLSLGIPVPPGFVLTSTAFDDFLIANDIVDIVGSKINDTDYTNIEAVKKAANEITQLIKKATMPQIIADPIAKAYGGMSGFSEAGVNLLVSSLNSQLEQSISKSGSRRYQVVGQRDLIEMVKTLWADFFSYDALMYREQIQYEGYLTEAIIVQKMLFPEVSGRVYSFNPTDNDTAIYEAQAIWGGNDESMLITPDSYILDAATGEIIERKITSQAEMFVRKGRYDGKGLFSKVKISPVMQKRAKLDDRNLKQLHNYTSKIAEITGKNVEVVFGIEAGRTYILDYHVWGHVAENEEHFEMPKSDLEQKILDDNWGSKIEIIPGEPDLNPDDDYEYKKKAQKSFQKDLDRYVAEIQKEEVIEPIIEVQPRFGQPIVVEQVKEVVSEPVPVIVEEAKSIEEKPVEKIIEQQVEKDADKVVVDIKPLSELQPILKGSGVGNKVRFGLSHFVLESFDLEDLTGDEILVIKQLSIDNLKHVNMVRGAILESMPDPELLKQLTVPVIYGLKNAFEVMRDREVITLEPETGKIYLGAGVNNLPKETEPVVETKVEKGVTTEVEPIQEQMSKEPQIQRQAVLETNEDILDEQVHPLHDKIETRPELSAFVVNVFEHSNIAPLNTTTEFWQSVDMLNPLVDVKNTAGIIITAEQLYLKFALEPIEVFSDKTVFKEFLFKAANFIKDLILKSQGRTIIYQSASHDYLEAKNITEHVHDMVLVDLEVISWLRNRENLRNIWYSFADVNTAEYLADVKKNVSSEGIRRSATFKLLAHIAQPYGVIAIKSIVENNNIDGVIIDLDRLIKSMGVNFHELDDNLTNFLKYVVEIVSMNNCHVFLWNNDIVIDNAQIKVFLEKGLSNFIVPVEKVMDTKLQVADQELARLIKQKKRGRKSKKIDFGF